MYETYPGVLQQIFARVTETLRTLEPHTNVWCSLSHRLVLFPVTVYTRPDGRIPNVSVRASFLPPQPGQGLGMRSGSVKMLVTPACRASCPSGSSDSLYRDLSSLLLKVSTGCPTICHSGQSWVTQPAASGAGGISSKSGYDAPAFLYENLNADFNTVTHVYLSGKELSSKYATKHVFRKMLFHFFFLYVEGSCHEQAIIETKPLNEPPPPQKKKKLKK